MLGKTVSDVITGFMGVVTAECTYITGCKQALVAGRSGEGKPADPVWFDVDRLEVVDEAAVVLPRTSDGFDIPAPKR